MRPIVEGLNPKCFAIERVLQCVRPRGVVSSVLVTTFNLVIANQSRRSWPRLIVQPIHTVFYKTLAPFSYRRVTCVQYPGNLPIRL